MKILYLKNKIYKIVLKIYYIKKFLLTNKIFVMQDIILNIYIGFVGLKIL